MTRLVRLFAVALVTLPIAAALQAQDTRTINEPNFPAICAVYRAPLTSDATGPLMNPSNEDQESSNETSYITSLFQNCAGKAVEFALGADPQHNAFLIDPLTIPPGVSLILDGGVTVYASRNPANYQIRNAPATCGTVTPDAYITGVCQPILTFQGDSSNAANSGLYGYGVLDGQGQRPILANPTPINNGLNPSCPNSADPPLCSWWDLIVYKDSSGKTYMENSPYTISAGNTQDVPLAGNFTLYKVTIRNPPYHTIAWAGDGLTVWGVHVLAPWNVPNTDGFDIRGVNLTLYDTTVSNGDDDIALGAGDSSTAHMTVRRFATYARDGLTILGNGNNALGDNISNLLFEDITMSADVPSFVTNADGTAIINGVSSADISEKWGISDYRQALPSSLGDVHGINVKYNSKDATGNVPNITDVTYRNVCMHDIEGALLIAPQSPLGATLPIISNILFQNIHVLAPSSQFAANLGGAVRPSSYKIEFTGLPITPGSPNTPFFHPQFILSNVVFDDLTSGGSSVSSITALGNELSTAVNVYPAAFNAMAALPLTTPATITIGNTTLELSDNTYDKYTWTSTPRLANPCRPGIPFLAGELYASVDDSNASGLAGQPATRIVATSKAPSVSANAETDTINVAAATADTLLRPSSWITVKAGTPLILNAVVQPIMSQSTFAVPSDAKLGTVAIGSPAPAGQVRFYEGLHLIGAANLTANGTLATLTLPHLTPGLHLYTAQYPKDSFYSNLNFGLIAIYATH